MYATRTASLVCAVTTIFRLCSLTSVRIENTILPSSLSFFSQETPNDRAWIPAHRDHLDTIFVLNGISRTIFLDQDITLQIYADLDLAAQIACCLSDILIDIVRWCSVLKKSIDQIANLLRLFSMLKPGILRSSED